jgi:hypothetical protein
MSRKFLKPLLNLVKNGSIDSLYRVFGSDLCGEDRTQSDGREPSGSFQRGVVDARLDLARAAPVNENKSTAAQWTVALYIYRLGALLVVTKAEGAARLAIFLRQARTSHAPSLERGAESRSLSSLGAALSAAPSPRARQSRRKKCPNFSIWNFRPY